VLLRGFLQPGELPERLGLLAEPLLAAQAVDGAVAGGGGDPRAGVVGHPLPRPSLDGDGEGLLDGLLGQVEVADDPDQGRDRPPRLLPEQAVDDPRDVGAGGYACS
jgi:hypothetical protein